MDEAPWFANISGSETGYESAKEYNIRAVPTVVVDGKIAIVGKPTSEEVKQLFN